MIGYRFLSVAEEEMSEAALFYEAASPGFGEKFLADVQHAVDRVRTHPEVGVDVASGLRRVLLQRFPV